MTLELIRFPGMIRPIRLLGLETFYGICGISSGGHTLTRIKIIREIPPFDEEWIKVPTKVVDLSGGRNWFKEYLSAYLGDVPLGYRIVQFETIGGSWLSNSETSDDSNGNRGILQDSA